MIQIYIHIYTYISTHTHLHIHVSIHIYIYIYKYIIIHTHIHSYVYNYRIVRHREGHTRVSRQQCLPYPPPHNVLGFCKHACQDFKKKNPSKSDLIVMSFSVPILYRDRHVSHEIQ